MALLWFSTSVSAAQTVPYKINFQGRLTNISGTVLTGSYDMQFKLYTTAAVGSGTYVWGETRTAANSNAVTVTNGLFNVLIGEGTAVAGSSASLQAAVTANSTLYLEVTVGGEILSQSGNLRSQFGSSAYAVNSDFLDGLDSTAFSQLSSANSFTNTNSVDVSSSTAFVVKSGSSGIVTVDTTGAGKVVIGTSDSNATMLVLDVNASDPTGANGGMYYNSSGKFRCYQGGAWMDCIGATTALSNLTTTSINQSLIANANNTLDLGASSTAWRTGYFGTSVAAPAVRPLADSATALQIQNAAGTSTFLTLNTTSSQIEIGSSALAGKLAISDGSSNFATITVSSLAANYTVNIPAITANDTICLLTNGNCVTTLQGGYNASTGGTTPEIKVSSAKGGVTIQDADTTIAGTLFSVTQSNASNLGTAIFSVDSTGAVSLGLAGMTTTLPGNISSTGTFSSTGATALFKPSSSAANAFQIQNSSSLVLFSADTSATRIQIGSSTSDSTAVLFVQDSSTTQPTGVNGGSYYNSTNNKFRCYQGGIWMDCGNGFNTQTLTADQAATQNSTTMQNVTALGFSVAANTTYVFDAWIPVNDSNANPDLKYTFTTPASSTQSIMTSYQSTTASSIVSCTITVSGTACANTTVNTASHFIQVKGYVAVAGTAGTVQFQFAQNTAYAASFPVIKKGATISWHQSN